MIIWWCSFPLLVLGIWYSMRYRLRQIAPILIFTTMLSVAYSIFQGKRRHGVSPASAVAGFYFIFVAVGFVLIVEKREERDKRTGA